MAATNIFYRIPSQRGTRVATIAGSECTLDQFCDYIIDSEGLNRNDFIVASGTKVFRPSSCSLQSINLQNNSHVDIIIPLLGGKGGFGSLLRAIGAQIEKTTNRDACRDLSGRRLRDVKREDELKKLIALQEKLQEERKRRRKEKLEKLKKKSEESSVSSSIQELVAMFDDHEYQKRRLEIGDIIEAAVDKGIINFKKRQQEEKEKADQEKNKKLRLERVPENGDEQEEREEEDSTREQSNNNKNLHQNGSLVITLASSCLGSSSNRTQANSIVLPKKHSKMRNDLWLGLEDDDVEI